MLGMHGRASQQTQQGSVEAVHVTEDNETESSTGTGGRAFFVHPITDFCHQDLLSKGSQHAKMAPLAGDNVQSVSTSNYKYIKFEDNRCSLALVRDSQKLWDPPGIIIQLSFGDQEKAQKVKSLPGKCEAGVPEPKNSWKSWVGMTITGSTSWRFQDKLVSQTS